MKLMHIEILILDKSASSTEFGVVLSLSVVLTLFLQPFCDSVSAHEVRRDTLFKELT
jgi:hypothetical protein